MRKFTLNHSQLKCFLMNRFDQDMAMNIINFFEIPLSCKYMEFVNIMNNFILSEWPTIDRTTRKPISKCQNWPKMKFCFLLHDLNKDQWIDFIDGFNLLKMFKNKSIMHLRDCDTIFRGIHQKFEKAKNTEMQLKHEKKLNKNWKYLV